MNKAIQGSRPEWVTLPNAITVLRLALVIPISILIVDDGSPVLALILLVVFGASDWVDGYLARKMGQTSRLGAMIDPIADRVGVTVIVLAFVLGGHLSMWIVIAIAGVDIALTVVFFVTRATEHAPVSIAGKIRTGLLMTGIALVGLGLLPGWNWASWLGQALCAVGAVGHTVAAAGYLRALMRTRTGSGPR